MLKLRTQCVKMNKIVRKIAEVKMDTEFNTNSKAIIIGMTDTGERIPAASGRISTQPGTALEILELSKDPQKNAQKPFYEARTCV